MSAGRSAFFLSALVALLAKESTATSSRHVAAAGDSCSSKVMSHPASTTWRLGTMVACESQPPTDIRWAGSFGRLILARFLRAAWHFPIIDAQCTGFRRISCPPEGPSNRIMPSPKATLHAAVHASSLLRRLNGSKTPLFAPNLTSCICYWTKGRMLSLHFLHPQQARASQTSQAAARARR